MEQLIIFTNDAMERHENMPSHLNAARLKVIRDMTAQDFPDTHVIQTYPASEDDILFAHPQSHLDFVLDKTPFEGWSMIDSDTGMNNHSYDCALLSVGTAIQAMQSVIDGGSQTAFALSRPPGHHAIRHLHGILLF